MRRLLDLIDGWREPGAPRADPIAALLAAVIVVFALGLIIAAVTT